MIADAIVRSMLRNKNLLLAAIYVDQMYWVILSKERINRGKAALCDIAVRMQQGNRLSNIEDQSFIASELSVPSSESGSEEEIDFEKHLDIEAKRRRTENEKGSENSEVSLLSKFKLDFSNALIEVEKIDRSSKLSVMEAILKYPEIVQNVAYTVSALPPTQVSVE